MAIRPLRPASQDLGRIAQEVAAIADLQHELPACDATLKLPDRIVDQYRIAGDKAIPTIAPELPTILIGVGLFDPGSEHIGIARASIGLGCPHAAQVMPPWPRTCNAVAPRSDAAP
jgi:hypothetical protein